MHAKGTVGTLVIVEWHTAHNRWKANLEDHDIIALSPTPSLPLQAF